MSVVRPKFYCLFDPLLHTSVQLIAELRQVFNMIALKVLWMRQNAVIFTGCVKHGQIWSNAPPTQQSRCQLTPRCYTLPSGDHSDDTNSPIRPTAIAPTAQACPKVITRPNVRGRLDGGAPLTHLLAPLENRAFVDWAVPVSPEREQAAATLAVELLIAFSCLERTAQ